MLVTEFGMSIDLIDLQPLKAPLPMEVTEFGMSMDFRRSHP